MEQGQALADAYRAARDTLIAQGTAEATGRANLAIAQGEPFYTAWKEALDKSSVQFYPKNTQWSVFISSTAGPRGGAERRAMEFRAVLTDPVNAPLAWTCQLVFSQSPTPPHPGGGPSVVGAVER